MQWPKISTEMIVVDSVKIYFTESSLNPSTKDWLG